jgi:sec-independent protein translocase protein TatC
MERELTFVEHLEELRRKIIISLLALGATSILSLPFSSYLLKILKIPAQGLIDKLVVFGPDEALSIYMRLGLLCGLTFSMPVLLYQLWDFVSPAIEERLKRYAGHFIFFCFFTFVAGGLFAFFILIPPVLRFLLSFAKDDLEPLMSASKYFSFVVSLILGCGLVFEMPILSLLLTKLRIINASTLRRKYKYAVVIILIVAAIITPTTDIFNMLILALPMLFLYEFSIWISFFAQPRAKVWG